MNLLMFTGDELQDENRLILKGHRLVHLANVLKVSPGDSLRVGRLNGKIGQGRVEKLGTEEAWVTIESLDQPPPAPLPVNLILAVPRPKMLKRVLQCATAMGVKHIHLINSYKVEKSFWASPWLTEEKIRENLVLGLEQAQDTSLPEVHLHKLFKPFVEDVMPQLSAETRKLVAHPYTNTQCPENLTEPTTLAIGPEGGFTDYEIGKFGEQDFHTIKMGQRILRVETAVPALLAKLFPFS